MYYFYILSIDTPRIKRNYKLIFRFIFKNKIWKRKIVWQDQYNSQKYIISGTIFDKEDEI